MESSGTPELKVAVVGCGHGELDNIYATLESECERKGFSSRDLDFLIICGDFQAVRNELDLNCMSVPHRHRKLGDFHKYYSGAAQAPVLTIVVGGNHEASNYHFELYHGGWLAPNIYYLGAAGVIRYGPWRIAGISGIYNPRNYHKPHSERLPYDRDDIRSVYHVREYDVQRLLFLRSPVDIALSHDWPAWVELFGDHKQLFATKPTFLTSALANSLGSKPATELLGHLRPSYWFAGHMHIRFEATVELEEGAGIYDALKRLEDVPEKLRALLPRPSGSSSVGSAFTAKTEFLGLSKVGSPTFQWLEVRNLGRAPYNTNAPHYSRNTTTGKFDLNYDEEWLAITRACFAGLQIADPETLVVAPSRGKKVAAMTLDEERKWVKENIVDKGLLSIPRDFVAHAPVHNPDLVVTPDMQPLEYPNQQTARFCELLQIPNKFAMPSVESTEDAGLGLL
ncbi:lariat debranching enzyme, C-terminal domain-containing protein [Cercophora newfieldiana]|uniref:Lariat debranching enzyme, C-terminal domain-containing protein n=1 Tax=Cercophora newfieldiana TaxID=92897 RepID=A0AA39YCX4_9PEZI|nr:lariat debranching enzyme, C-terminal domain-containing protein [Cercophora newfieldiana]